jgi:hypothetical protein
MHLGGGLIDRHDLLRRRIDLPLIGDNPLIGVGLESRSPLAAMK